MSDLNQDWVLRDLNVLWHPCTQMKDHETLPMIPIKRAQGVYLEDFNGARYIDSISSWWVNLLGHCNPRINAAIKNQLDQLEHVILAGFSHEPAIKLAEKLIEIAPSGLTRCFYADNGSSAIEVALKMSYHAWRNQGETQKKLFFTLDNSYHGETTGALSVSQVGLYKNTYQDLLFDVISIPVADTFHQPVNESYETYADKVLIRVEKLFEQYASQACALILEPLVQCAGKMRMYQPYFLKKLYELTRKYHVHFIADEIAVGFGRTGTMFACEQANITPDFMCLSKGLTGGYLPMSAILTTDVIYQCFYDDYGSNKAFLHSHSYTGNPLACAAALATIDILQRDNIILNNQKKIDYMARACQTFKTHPQVAQVRQTGMIMAIELKQPRLERPGLVVYQHALSQGVLLRPIGNVIYFMPPYVITESEMDKIIDVALEGIDLIVEKEHANIKNLSTV